MKYLKNLGKSLLITIIIMFVLTFICTLLNYFDIINSKYLSIFKIIIPLFSLGVGGFFLGRKSNKKGFLEGLKFGFIVTILILIFNLIFGFNLTIKDLIFYLALILSSMFGSMLGINTK